MRAGIENYYTITILAFRARRQSFCLSYTSPASADEA